VDYATVSAHKAYGPKGVGALQCRPGAPVPTPLLWGGGQEDGYRAGTTPLALIVGFEAALAAALPTVPAQATRLEGLIAHTIAQLAAQAPQDASYRINTPLAPQQRIAGVLNLSFPKQRGDAMVLKLGMKGFALSSGSACHGESVAPSHVLLAQGRNSAEALGALRISLGHGTTAAELEALIPHLLRWL
jgi:cysteine desulfurase